MKLSKNNFYFGICRFKRPGKIDIEGIVYTYETNNAIYDVAIVSGVKYYQSNMKGYFADINDAHYIHYAIEKHYKI